MSRTFTTRGPSVALVAVVLGASAWALLPGAVSAQPGTVLSFVKHNSTNLAPLGVQLDNLDEFGDAVAWLGDLDGAGPSAAAVAVGTIGDDDGGSACGAVHILFLNSAGAVLSRTKIAAAQGGFTGVLEANDEFGSSVAWLGDIDGAGPSAAAIAVGAIGDDDGGTDRGAVYVLLLNSSGTVTSTQKLVTTQVGISTQTNAFEEDFGGSVAGLGDLDGVGPSAAAVAVGASGDDTGGEDRGAVFVVFLSSSGAFLSYTRIASGTANFAATIDNIDLFGSSVGAVGDLDGASPGVRTLAVGAPEDDDGGSDSGALYLVHLLANGTVSSWSKISRTAGGWTSPVANLDVFGSAVSGLGDLDGAGPSTSALAVSAPGDDGLGTNRGAVYVLFLSAANAVNSHVELSSSAGGTISAQLKNDDEFGTALAGLGDLDGAGAGAITLVSGVGLNDDGGTDRGAIFLLDLNGAPPAAPVVSAPPTASVAENAPLTVNVTASDADGPAITSLTATNLPAGATFTPGAGNTTGTLQWTPTWAQAGVYTVSFTASNTLSGSTSTQITVTNVDRAPVVTAKSTAYASVGNPMAVLCSVSDPDGDPISTLQVQNLPPGASFTPGPGNGSGRFDWTPSTEQTGHHLITFAAANILQGTTGTDITVALPTQDVGPGVALLHPVLAPSPMRQGGTLSFSTSEIGDVEVEVLDLSGRRVRTLAHEHDSPAGLHQLAFDGRGDRGERLPPGVYLYRVHAPHHDWTGRLVIAR